MCVVYKERYYGKITVKDTAKVQKVSAVDERIPEVPDTPQTGHNRLAIIFTLLALFGMCTTYSCIRVNHRKKKKNEA